MNINNRGLRTVIASVAIQLCLGTAYVWSVFQTGVANSIFKGDNAKASLAFSLLLAMLSVGGVIGGKLAVKYSPKIVIIAGGIILSFGFFLASLVNENIAWLLWVSYGVLGGIGMGFTYTTTIACAQKWYPNKKGLITGVIVSSLGLGGVIFTPIIERLIKLFGGQGAGEPGTFMVLSVIFLVVCTAGGFFIQNPPAEILTLTSDDSKKPVKKDYTPSQMFKEPSFYIAFTTLMFACMGGLMMMGFAKPIAVAKGLVETATIGVLLISVFNSAGRLVWGIISDKLGRENTIIVLLIGTAVTSLLVNMANGYWIFVLIGAIGFFYGGYLSNFALLTADLFGPKYMSANYGFVLLGFSVGAIVSSQIAGYYKNIAANDIGLMFPAFVIAAAFAVTGVFLMLLLKKIKSRQNV